MNIDDLILQLNNLKKLGAETVEVLDTNWNDYELDHVTTDFTGKRVLIFVNVLDEEVSEENNLSLPPVKN
jgi:hypothetical protein